MTSNRNVSAGLVRVPVSIGELLDKISILEIKSEHIRDPAKLKHVVSELDLLRNVWSKLGRSGQDLECIRIELKQTNETLWAIEDEIRECERMRDFGSRFIELARAVYRENDKRAGLKRRINELCGSTIVEEKSYRSY